MATEWFTSSDSFIMEPGSNKEAPVVMTVIFGSGTVLIQVQNASGSWITPDDAAYTIGENAIIELQRASMPATKITATGDATFAVYRQR